MKNNIKINLKKISKTLGYFSLGIFLILSIAIATLWFYSPGTAQLIMNSDGQEIENSISTIETLVIGNTEQSMIIRGVDKTKPVMLYLHGGPGSPEFSALTSRNKGLEENFVMVYWDQRGAGKSYSKDISIETMNMKQFVSDTKKVSEFLIKKFNKDKIYIMGHSWGTLLGMMTVNKNPELYHAYFGIGQNVSYQGEVVSLQWVRDQARLRGDREGVRELAALTLPSKDDTFEVWFDYIPTQRAYVSKYGGTVYNSNVSMVDLVIELLLTKEYTITDKINYMKGIMFSFENIGSELMNADLFNDINEIQIPVYILHGKHDYNTPYQESKKFFDQLEASEKEFFTFENSAHSPIVEEVEKFNKIILEKVDKIERNNNLIK